LRGYDSEPLSYGVNHLSTSHLQDFVDCVRERSVRNRFIEGGDPKWLTRERDRNWSA